MEHEEFEQEDFPRLRPNVQQKMPNRTQLKRSLLPENVEVIVRPNPRIHFPDKTRLKKQEITLSASIGRVVSWVPKSNGVRLTAAAAVAALIWFNFPIIKTTSIEPSAGIPPSPVQPEYADTEVLEPLILASHPSEIPSNPTLKKSIKPPAIWIDLPMASPLTSLAPQSPIGPERTASAMLLTPASLTVEPVILPIQVLSPSPTGELLMAFLDDQPIGGAVRAAKALPIQFGHWAESGKDKAQLLARQVETRRSELQNIFASRRNHVIELQEQFKMKWVEFWKKNQRPVTKMQGDASTAQTPLK